jgi:hypothetical protein
MKEDKIPKYRFIGVIQSQCLTAPEVNLKEKLTEFKLNFHNCKEKWDFPLIQISPNFRYFDFAKLGFFHYIFVLKNISKDVDVLKNILPFVSLNYDVILPHSISDNNPSIIHLEEFFHLPASEFFYWKKESDLIEIIQKVSTRAALNHTEAIVNIDEFSQIVL